VVKEKMAGEIIERAKKMAEDARLASLSLEEAGSSMEDIKGNLSYFPFHPAAWTEMVQGLDVDTKEEYEALAVKWNKEGVPKDTQQK
jgi:hypothetical protein